MSLDANPYARRPAPAPQRGPDGLADVLERILDKGLVVAGDIQINLLDIELITIKVRLLLASADTAQQMGIDWWKHDPFLTGQDRELVQENEILRGRVDQLEAAMGRKLAPGEPSPGDVVGEGAQDDAATRGQLMPTGARGHGGDGGEQDGPRHVEVEELILQHESGGPALRVTAADDMQQDAEEQPDADEVQRDAADAEPEADERQETVEQQEQDTAEEDDWLDEETIDAMTRSELQAELEARELPISGTKPVLRDRLLSALEDEWEEIPTDEETSAGVTDDDG